MAEPRRIDPNYKSARKNGRCYRGHRMTPENTYVQPNGYTSCRICRSENASESKRNSRAREKANG